MFFKLVTLLMFIGELKSEVFQGDRCDAPFCRNEGNCIDNQKSIQGFNCVCQLGFFGEICDRDYLTCPNGNQKLHVHCLPNENEKAFVFKDVCYKLVSIYFTYKDFTEYCLQNSMIPALIKSNETIYEIKKYFSKQDEAVFVGFTSENLASNWYDGSGVRIDPVFSPRIQCGTLEIENEHLSLANCFTPRYFICQKNMDCQDKSLDEYVSPCTPNPCLNGGTCFEATLDKFQCLCTSYFSGIICDHEIVQVSRNKTCHIAGFLNSNDNCYKLYKVKIMDVNWIETTCYDQESELIHELDSDSNEELLFLASLIDGISEGFNCIVTNITKSYPNIGNIMANLTLDRRIKFYDDDGNPEDHLFVCVSHQAKSLTAILQFRKFRDNSLDELYFVCKEIRLKKDDNESSTKSSNLCAYPEIGRNALVNFNGSFINFTCFDNMFANPGTMSRIDCVSQNQWNGRALECDYAKCDQPPPVFENAVMVRNTSTVILYDCVDETYALKSLYGYSFELKCIGSNKNGTLVSNWVGKNICVEKKPCSYPNEIPHGQMTMYEEGNQLKVEYRCDSSIHIRTEVGYCTNAGLWNVTLPPCYEHQCGQPPFIKNSVIHLNGFELGSRVTYQCISGFKSTGYYNSSTCNQDSNWTPVDFKCIELTCEKSIQIKNGKVHYTGNKQNDVAFVTCNMGYVVNNDDVVYSCQNGQWILESTFQIECQMNHCPVPVIKDKSMFVNLKLLGSYQHFDKIKFECIDGYELIGDEVVMCLPDSTWTSFSPICKKIVCKHPPQFDHIVINNTSSGSLVYSCKPGYGMIIPERQNSVSFTCLKSGKWFGPSIVKCAVTETKCEYPEPIEHGYFIYNGLRIGSMIVYICESNFVLHGENIRHCLNTGEWSASKPSCVPYKCPPLDKILNGNVEYDQFSALYECKRGYELIGDSERICLPSLKWSGSTPYCELLKCPPLENIENGKIILNGYSVNSTVLYLCNEGYDLVDGTKSRTCLPNQKWTGKTPLCRKIKFVLSKRYVNEKFFQLIIVNKNEPSSSSSSKSERFRREIAQTTADSVPMSIRGEDIYFYANEEFEFSVSCDNSSRTTGLINKISVSTSDDLNHLSSLKCENIECDNDSNQNLPSHVTVSNSNGNKTGSTIEFACTIGYNINSGSTSRICKQNGKWSGAVPTCSLVYCGMPKNGKNSFWKFGETPTVAYYSCNKGFSELNGDKVITCSYDSNEHRIKWKGNPLSCKELFCGNLNVSNATADISSYKFGSIAYLQCKPGFRAIDGNYIRSCSEYGIWTGEDLVCQSNEEFMAKYKEKYAVKISSSKAFGGIAVAFIVCLFLTSCIADFRWSLVCLLYYRLRYGHDYENVRRLLKKAKTTKATGLLLPPAPPPPPPPAKTEKPRKKSVKGTITNVKATKTSAKRQSMAQSKKSIIMTNSLSVENADRVKVCRTESPMFRMLSGKRRTVVPIDDTVVVSHEDDQDQESADEQKTAEMELNDLHQTLKSDIEMIKKISIDLENLNRKRMEKAFAKFKSQRAKAKRDSSQTNQIYTIKKS